MNYQAIRAVFEKPVLDALSALDPAVPIYMDNQPFTEPSAEEEYAVMRISFGETMEVTLSGSLDAVEGNVVVEIFTPKDRGPSRVQLISDVVQRALRSVNTVMHPASGAYGSVLTMNGPNLIALDERPHFVGRLSAAFRASYI